MSKQYPLVWDLETFFPGGSRSPELEQTLAELGQQREAVREQMEALGQPDSPAAVQRWHDAISSLGQLWDRYTEASAFVHCLQAQNDKDAAARTLVGRCQQLSASIEALEIQLRDRIGQVPDDAWQRLIADPRLEPVAFALQESRRQIADLLPAAQETLATDLAVDGNHAWRGLYFQVVSRMTIPFEADGRVEPLSAGQALNKFSHPDRQVRARLHANWEQAWADQSELIAAALNHLAGFRLNLYRHRGWDSPLKEPLENNRMSEATLNAMWAAVTAGKPRLAAYLERKAQLIGGAPLHWYDLSAPLPGHTAELPFDQAAEFVVEQFGRFSPQMARFASRALLGGWVESENRPGKRPGAFCIDFPLSRQTRVFMTHGNDWNSLRTLAHELGHAFHAEVTFDLPPQARAYAMNVAETASTFAELVVAKSAIANAAGPAEQLVLLDASLREATALLMDIHARFLFETRFYAARRGGPVSAEQLNELMVAAQQEAFAGALGTYHPHFWASKRHFYFTHNPFYNFPYTFGYLFSAGIYARAAAEGPAFEQKYIDLLRDTGRMTTEELAWRHLGVDLTRPDFWVSAVNLALEDVDTFLQLTE